MRNWRTIVGALCIVLAMMLGAFAGFVYARPGGVGVSPDLGTRGEDRRVVGLSDLENGPMSPEEAVASVEDAAAPRPAATQDPIELVTPDGNLATARPVTEEEVRQAALQSGEQRFVTEDGTITVTPETRGAWPPGTIDAGGPYGGPDVFEGGPAITFTVTANDPAIIFFRWDFNNDGTFDYPDQTGGGTLGRWTTETTVVKQFFDNYYGDIAVQGWDGVSTIINIVSGNNLGGTTTFNISLGMFGADYRWVGWRFTAKKDVTVKDLGYYHYTYTIYQLVIRSWTSGAVLGQCEPVHLTLRWNWCTLPTPVSLVGGQDYFVAERILSSSVGINTPPATSVVQFGFSYGIFCYVPNEYCWTPFQWGTTWIPMVDFTWTYTEILPDAASDDTLLEVHNVAPSVFNVMTTPSPGLEGGTTYLTAQFNDPGLDDTWEYRWTFLDGTTSGWRPIDKMNGGAKVLMLHTWYTAAASLRTLLVASCGTFCTKIDMIDFGPTGQNRNPTLAELLQYDVLLVGTNYGPLPSSSGMGDLLANYMDAGGNVVMAQFGFDNRDTFGIGGRWQSDAYTPVDRTTTIYSVNCLGSIYVPGHPILDGVASLCSNYRTGQYGVTAGATLVATFLSGTVAIGTKENPKVNNGARAVALPWFPLPGYGTTGDYVQIVVNSIRWASRQPDPTVKPMPITTNPYAKVFMDDFPTTTTPQDTFGVHVEVRDDDDQKIEVHSQTPLYFQDFQTVSQCSYPIWPTGWSAVPTTGWRCLQDANLGSRGAIIYYYYNDFQTSNLYTNTFDLSAYIGVRLNYRVYWAGDYAAGTSDGYIEGTTNGGATWTSIKEYHHNNPARFNGNDVAESAAIGGAASVQLRFRYVSGDDWWWMFDNLQVTGIVGEVISGLGSADGFVTIANVPPTITGGFDSALRDEAQGLLFKGFQIADPALLVSTEWFAYSVDFDDGSAVDWVYKGSLAPPKLKVYVVHTLCPAGNTCIYYTDLRNALLAQDDVASVDGHNYFSTLSAPTLSTMMQYDVIIIAGNYAYLSYAPFDLVRRQIGDRLADYLDSGRGGVVTEVGVHSLYSGVPSWDLDGRYINDKYGAFQGRVTLAGAAQGMNKLDPDHDLFVQVGSDVNSLFVSAGNMPLSVGGGGNAAGVNGQLLARFVSTGNTMVGVKELNNGARTAHIGVFGQPSGVDTRMLLRNAIGWVKGGLPSPSIPPVTHTYGDNGVYTVDFAVIDDDMGYVWDPVANMPVEVMPGVQIAHRYVPVTVNNVDPTIVSDGGSGAEAFIAAQVCLRVSGTAGNTVTLGVLVDGALATSVATTRMNGDPNPPTEKCGMVRVDVTAPHTYAATLDYANPAGGSNPTWLIFSPWREPVTPGHGTVSYKYDFDAAGTINAALPTLKTDLFDKGQGAKIDFVAEAWDAGTDDLAFFWSWGTVDGMPYAVPNPTDAVYTIHVYHNDGAARTDGALSGPQYLGYSESFFDRTANTGRSPMGTTGFRVRDTAVHAFDLQQSVYYVMLLVLDDDNTRGYASAFAPNDGVDMQFIVVDLR